MRTSLFGIALLAACAAGVSAANVGPMEAAPEFPAVRPTAASIGAAVVPVDPGVALAPLAPSTVPSDLQAPALQDQAPSATERPASLGQQIQQVSVSAAKEAPQAGAPAGEGGAAAASRQFALLSGERAAAAVDEEPTDEDVQAARRAMILRNPTVPERVSRLIERETGLTADHPVFEHVSRYGSQPRNSHTNEPLGEAHAPVNPKRVIVGLFHLRQESPEYYRSLKNPRTGVMATGVRGGVDLMIDDLLEKGSIPPRSAGRNLRFLNGVYMDLPDHIHEVRKYAAVDPYRTEGKDRYPMVVAFRASNVHNPGADYQGRIVGDGGTLGHVALDKVAPQDVVSIYVQRSRIAQTVERLKGTALAHVQVYPMDILPAH